ncbi:MAG: hypothetical protein NC548_53660 [Lachnospiraceae bacterium]|nr:hypothetical protein [Lachnospiraceae bacterium]
MEKPTAIYIHGYLSGANSSTGQKLKAMKGERFNILTPEVDADPEHSLEIINKLIQKTKPAIIIGSSMGGLYTLACNSGETPLLLINPLLTPVETITEHFFNKTLSYHSQRLDGATETTITNRELSQFAEIGAKIPSLIEAKKPYLAAILSTRDELLGDSHIRILQDKITWLHTFNDFGHRCGDSCLRMIGSLMESAIEP